MSRSTKTPTTIPMMDPASKSTPANRAKKERYHGLSLSWFLVLYQYLGSTQMDGIVFGTRVEGKNRDL